MAIGSFFASGGALSETDAEYLRIASISVAIYEYILTLPAEYRFYSSQARWSRPSLACILFVLIRYSSVLIIIISNLGQFASFSEAECNRYYLLAPIFKVVQIVICQAILSVRTFAISERDRRIGFVLGFFFLVCAVGEGVGSNYGRVPNNESGRCISGNLPQHHLAWLHYLFSMVFDIVTLVISFWYLLGRQPREFLSFGGIGRMMVVDGLGYFVLLTAANIVNMIFWTRAPLTLQSSAASLGYVVMMIGCQRILIRLREHANHSSSWTPRQPTSNSAPDGGRPHEMSIRVTIQQDVEAYPNGHNARKSSDTMSTHKQHAISFFEDRPRESHC